MVLLHERSDKSKNWIDINGETLKRLGKDVQYGSLEDYISKEQIQALRSVLAENYQHPLEPLKQK